MAMTQCPVSARKVTRVGEEDAPRVGCVDGVWQIRSVEAARELLRMRDASTQAGFHSEDVRQGLVRRPILFADGEPHRKQRSKIARYFAPATVSKRYRSLMHERADALIADMIDRGVCDLSNMSMRYSVEVAAEVVGLTNSNTDKMAGRLVKFFGIDLLPTGDDGGRLHSLRNLIRGQLPMLSFYLHDVRPAIRRRRKHPTEDVISYLIEEGYADHEILIECITYGAAGMVTTREFISMVTWHLVNDAELRTRYLAAEERERYQILWEILRLEPIVGHLYRRTTKEVVLHDDGEEYVLPEGALVDLFIRHSNADPVTVGEDALRVCPGRTLPKGVSPEVVSFGDGAHKCPGNSLAIQETDVLMTRLLAHHITILNEPTIGWDDLIAGYELRDFMVKISAEGFVAA